jgi:glutathione synthase/RimK-type ligase-like ATP-grasp enzyme
MLILKNEDPYDHLSWVKACEDFKDKILYEIVDLTKQNWLSEIKNFKPDFLLLKPSAKTSLFRELYQERIDILINDLNYKSFPSFEELRLYENKRFFAYWTQAHNIPAPKTWIFYNRNEALSFIEKINYPIVGKLNIGASGSGVKILKNKKECKKYINQAFYSGLTSETGPKLQKGKIISRIWRKTTHPKELLNRFKTYYQIATDKQKGFVLLQEFIPHNYEWRAVRIGDSFFVHKKIVEKEKASGTLKKGYENPPFELLDFLKNITDRFNFKSVAIDIFEPEEGKYIINEIQCIFGQSDPYQMLIDEKPGRYRYIGAKWSFEEGNFNQNQSYNLRVEYLLSKMLLK